MLSFCAAGRSRSNSRLLTRLVKWQGVQNRLYRGARRRHYPHLWGGAAAAAAVVVSGVLEVIGGRAPEAPQLVIGNGGVCAHHLRHYTPESVHVDQV